ncbi:MAG: DUF6977 family protein [Suipraeoptans sp.]
MASRPVFIAKNKYPFYEINEVEFDYFPGFATSQKQKSIRSLHDSFTMKNPEKNILEISTKSTKEIGVSLSAFNLSLNVEGERICVECAFQGSKKFENSGPFSDIYKMNPWEVKKDSRLKEGGAIVSFSLNGEVFGNEPKDFFYNWTYIKALYENKEYLEKVKAYSSFTDIEFNPKKSLNCQAKAIAIAIGLMQAGMLEYCMENKENFLKLVYGEANVMYEQLSLFG